MNAVAREFKNQNPGEYKKVHTVVLEHKIREAKDFWTSEQRKELENFQQKHNNFNGRRRIKQLNGINKRTAPYKLTHANNQPAKCDKEESTLEENYTENLNYKHK